VSVELRDRVWAAVVVAVGAVLLVASIGYLELLRPLVDPEVVVFATVGIAVASTIGLRVYLANHPPLDPARPSTAALTGLVDELVTRTGLRRPRLALDESRLAKAVANVGAVEFGPRSETILVTEQLVADLEAGRFGLPSLRGVVLHELGHLHHQHSYLKLWTSIPERLIRFAAIAALVAIVFSGRARTVVAEEPQLALAIALGPFVVASILALISRGNETQADDFAIRHAAGRDLLDFLRWMSTDLAPFFALDRAGVPRLPAERVRIREGLERLVTAAEHDGDEERAAFFREAIERLAERDLEDRADLPPGRRLRYRLRRLGRTVALAWLGIVPWNRSHPPLDQRMARIAAEIGSGATPAAG
jgi:Zn-dependent protease with chaperone function